MCDGMESVHDQEMFCLHKNIDIVSDLYRHRITCPCSSQAETSNTSYKSVQLNSNKMYWTQGRTKNPILLNELTVIKHQIRWFK